MKKIYIIFIIILLVLLFHRFNDNFENPKKVAICFFGLCRSTHHTADSIKKNIYNALDNLNIDYDVYLHTYKIDKEYNNKWSNESNVLIDNDNYKLLNPDYKLIENEDDVIQKIDLTKYRKHGDPWKDTSKDNTFMTLNNAILSLYSTYQVTQMWKNTGIKYDAIICLRPDVLYLKPLTIDYFNSIQDNLILIPNFAEYPINDRFAIGNSDVMEKYGNRFLDAYQYSLINALHTETYLNYYLNKLNIKIKKINYKFCRIRINGENRDLELL
jgi:hypothetical protein